MAKESVFVYGVQTGSGIDPASYTMGTGSTFLEGKAAGLEADH
jgi:hypothetical protein